MFEVISHNSPDSLLASFLCQGVFQPCLMILTGSSGAGKTSWCQTLAARVQAKGLFPAGLLSPAVFRDSEKVGIDLRDLATGQQRSLARRNTIHASPEQGLLPTTSSHWLVNQDTLVWGNSILAGLDRPPVVVIDELGPLEFERGLGFMAGLELLDSQRHGLASVVIRPSLLAHACERWPWARVLDLQEPEAAA